MALAEFKAWFEGYTEDLEGAPTEQQFARIKEKVKAIDGTPITYPIFVDRWWPTWHPQPTYWGDAYAAHGKRVDNSVVVMNASVSSGETDSAAAFDSRAAMYAIGKADALAA